MPTITLPHKFTPRSYQLPVLKALDRGTKRVVAIWHRRAGKEKTLLNYTIRAAFERIGAYFYLFPTYRQAKKAIWDGRDREGFPFLGHFPPEIIKSKREDELKITLVNGSIVQLVGTDNIDALMSTNPVGCVFAEYALQDPRAWEYLRPILLENDGWAAFDFTPRGKNHGYELYELARKMAQEGDPRWFCERLTVDDTGAITPAQIEQERRDGMSDEMVRQEFYCSFEGVQEGSIFGRQMDEAESDGRICGVPWQPEFPVSTWWDIGTGDGTAIWFTQDVGREIHVIDYYESAGTGVGIDHYVRYLQTLPYLWGSHNGPHDIEAASFAAGGRSAKEVAAAMGFHFHTIPRCSNKMESITAARLILKRCWFGRAKTERGRLALQSYHFPYDEKRKAFGDLPYHDWSSEAADAFQQLGMGHRTAPPQRIETERPMVITVGGEHLGWLGA